MITDEGTRKLMEWKARAEAAEEDCNIVADERDEARAKLAQVREEAELWTDHAQYALVAQRILAILKEEGE